jgi:iron(III) transport system ATP-binding protein
MKDALLNSEHADAYVRLSRVSKLFSAFSALRDVSFSIGRGELVCLLGPSGCGKTTLLRAIAGLDPQSSGRIELDGRDVSNLPPAKRNFGIVFQSYALFPNLTIFDNVGYGLVARRLSRETIKKRITELLDLVGLAGQGHKFPAQMSGGQQQRVALARALATSPALLLLDEPLSALDAQVRVYLREEIRSLQKRLGITTILVTHDQEEALAIADRIVLMNEGEIEQIGTPQQLYDLPSTEFVMRFVGASTCLSGVVERNGSVRVGCHTQIQTRGLEQFSPGQSVALCFRPEDVRLASTVSKTSLATVVQSLTFQGSHWRALLALAADHSSIIQADFSAEALRRISLTEGAPVQVELAPERLHLFARQS